MPDLSQKIQQLYQQFGELSGITIELHKELIAIGIDNRQAQATVFLQGAQLTHFQPKGGKAIIWNSELNDYRSGVAIRGGIPLCWPWFGALAKNPPPVLESLSTIDADSAPAHGFVRDRDWQLDAINVDDPEKTQLLFTLSVNREDYPGWPYACELSLRIEIGQRLRLTLSTLNNSERAIAISAALHSYFAVDDITLAGVTGFENSDYLDCLAAEWPIKQQTGAIGIDCEVDRIYTSSPQPIGLNRGSDCVFLYSKGSNSTVVWNPWIEKARRLSHFDDEAYKKMLCIETAQLSPDAIALASGQTHELQLTISN